MNINYIIMFHKRISCFFFVPQNEEEQEPERINLIYQLLSVLKNSVLLYFFFATISFYKYRSTPT